MRNWFRTLLCIALLSPGAFSADHVCCELHPNKKPLWVATLPHALPPPEEGCEWQAEFSNAIAFAGNDHMIAGLHFSCWRGSSVATTQDVLFAIDGKTGAVVAQKPLHGLSMRKFDSEPLRLFSVEGGHVMGLIGNVLKLIDGNVEVLKTRELPFSSAGDNSPAWKLAVSADGAKGVAMRKGGTIASLAPPPNTEYHWFSTTTLEDFAVDSAAGCSFLTVFDDTITCDTQTKLPHVVSQLKRGSTLVPLCDVCGGTPLASSINGVTAIARSDHTFWLVQESGRFVRESERGDLNSAIDAATSIQAPMLAVSISGPIPGLLDSLFIKNPKSHVIIFQTNPISEKETISFREVPDRSIAKFFESWPRLQLAFSANGQQLAILSGYRIYLFALN